MNTFWLKQSVFILEDSSYLFGDYQSVSPKKLRLLSMQEYHTLIFLHSKA